MGFKCKCIRVKRAWVYYTKTITSTETTTSFLKFLPLKNNPIQTKYSPIFCRCIQNQDNIGQGTS